MVFLCSNGDGLRMERKKGGRGRREEEEKIKRRRGRRWGLFILSIYTKHCIVSQKITTCIIFTHRLINLTKYIVMGSSQR